MEVANPRRVLAVSLADSTQHLSRVIKDLTGEHPEPASTSLAGTTHVLSLKTAYYTADVPVWLDLISSPAEWSASFLSPEAKEVLDVLGGLAIVFAIPAAASSTTPAPPSTTTTAAAADSATAPVAVAGPAAPSAEETRALITEVGKVVRDGLGGWSWDGVGLGIGVGEGDAEEWEELCAEVGLEFVQVRGGKKDDGRNEFGEKMGISRVLEALESNDWAGDDAPGADSDSEDLESQGLPRRPRPLAAGDGVEDDDDDEFDFDPENLDFGFDKSDFEGLKKAIWNLEQDQGDDDNDDADADKTKTKDGEGSAGKKTGAEDADEDLDGAEVEKLEHMMQKLQAVRDMSAGLPVDQRRRIAKKAVEEVMKEL